MTVSEDNCQKEEDYIIYLNFHKVLEILLVSLLNKFRKWRRKVK